MSPLKNLPLDRPSKYSRRGLVLGNCPHIQNKRKQPYSNTYIFSFAKELLRVPDDCSQKVSQYIAVCLRSSLLTLGLDFLIPYRQSTCMAEF